jgi:hypothetical protein
VAGQLVSRLNQSVAALAGEFDLEDLQVELTGIAAMDLDALDIRERADPEAGRASLLDDGLPLLTLGSSMGGLLAKTLGTGGAFLPGLIVALPIAVMRYTRRKKVQARQDYLRVVREILGAVRQELIAELQLKVIEARGTVEAVIEDAIAERRREIEARRGELAVFLKQDTARQQELRVQVEKRLAALEGLQRDCAQLRDRLGP